MEKTFVMIKPDGVRRQLVGKILQRFEEKGLQLLDLKMTTLSKAQLERHYEHLVARSFFPELLEYMMSGPVVQFVLVGPDAVQVVRQMVGATNPLEADSGSIRGCYGLSHTENVIHASDSLAAGRLEIARFF
ncbi:nucleoside-diphosphate kinase [Enterococcus sp. LJL98]